jgi:hypothetical protein
MTAIRKTTLQVAYFQYFINLTTEFYTSNDRFGLKILETYLVLQIAYWSIMGGIF